MVEHKTKTVWVCRNFVERLYSKIDEFNLKEDVNFIEEDGKERVNLTVPTKKFDKCGFIFNEKRYVKNEIGDDLEVEMEE